MTALVSALAALYIRLVLATSRIDVIGQDIPERFWQKGEPFILAFWHGQMLMMVRSWQTTRPIRMLISQNHDGEVIARAIGSFGIGTVRGSSDKNGKDKGGRAAIRLMLKTLKAGDCVGFTPDGPKGPRFVAKEGVAVVARMSGAPVIPVVAASSRRKVVGSWDRFVVNLPFSRAVILWGEPIHVPRDADAAGVEAGRFQVEEALNRLSADACARVGMTPVEAAA